MKWQGQLQEFVDPGQMDRPISVWKPVVTRSASGHATQSWEMVLLTLMKVEYNRRSEGFTDMQEKALTTATFTMRYNEDLKNDGFDSKWKLQDDQGRDWAVQGWPEELGRKRYWVVTGLYIE